MPTHALTFEAWLSSPTGLCNKGTILSYAEKTNTTDSAERTRAYNAFVIWDVSNLIACRGFQYLTAIPDPRRVSCRGKYGDPMTIHTGDFTSKDGAYVHVAVTWDASRNGETKVYRNGLLVGLADTGQTMPLNPGGAFVLGAEQDCLGGCFEAEQSYVGFMDEVRLWDSARSQADIIANMRRRIAAPQTTPGLVAYWDFDDPGVNGEFAEVAKDASGHGHDITLRQAPQFLAPNTQVVLEPRGGPAGAGALHFDGGTYAMTSDATRMPVGDFSIAFWARTPPLDPANVSMPLGAAFLPRMYEMFNYAAVTYPPGADRDPFRASTVFTDDSILIEKYSTEFKGTPYLRSDISTVGAISVHINSNRQGNGQATDNWIDFVTDPPWIDGNWHHVLVSWSANTGAVRLYFDGKPAKPFWKASGGFLYEGNPVESSLSARSTRSATGTLALGTKVECPTGCFTSHRRYSGDLGEVHIFSRVLTDAEVAAVMKTHQIEGALAQGLVSSYHFELKQGGDRRRILDEAPGGNNPIILGGVAARWHLSYAPLASDDGAPLARPEPGPAGYAMVMSDARTLYHPEFRDFPGTELTLEAWLWSVDTCRQSALFSYATGNYQESDNAFLLFSHNDWGVSVMEDEGTFADHYSGITSANGEWNHVAVTWRSVDGETRLYQNGVLVWTVTRGSGAVIPSGGFLVIGREQDCRGGCLDSDTSPGSTTPYGSQDFFGMVKDIRLWHVVRSAEQIGEGMRADEMRAGGDFHHPGIPLTHPDLTAWWRFDEGSGYTVKDSTGHGHDLQTTSEPEWRVIRWLGRCGDGVMQAGELCDDGNRVNGDGCSTACRIEEGYACVGVSPSLCFKGKPDTPHPGPSGGGSGGGGGGGGTSGALASVVLSVLAALVLVPTLGFLAVASYAFSMRRHSPAADSLANQIESLLHGTFVERLVHRWHARRLGPYSEDLAGSLVSPPGPSAGVAEPAGPHAPLLHTPTGAGGRYAELPSTPDFGAFSPSRDRDVRRAMPLPSTPKTPANGTGGRRGGSSDDTSSV